MVIVTHGMRFAYDVATRVVFMDEGEIAEQGSPQEVFNNPRRGGSASCLRLERRGRLPPPALLLYRGFVYPRFLYYAGYV
jgi:energy-coupling factor transporter ATP-binding protein EcfA2